MRIVIMSLVCSVLVAGVIVQAEESSAQLTPPVTFKAATNNGNFNKKYDEWKALMEGKNGVPKDEAKARQILPQLIKGICLVKFGPAEGFNPQTPAEYIPVFFQTSSLRSGQDGGLGIGFLRTKCENNKLMASFLTDHPDQMKKDIEKNPQLVFVSMEEITPDKFISYDKSVQELLQHDPVQRVTSEQSGKNIVLLRYSVQADEEVAYEVCLDGKFVSSGKALIKQDCYLSLPASPGDHILTVTAPGYETWQKTITLLEGSKNGQNFLIELKKLTK